MTHRSCWLPRGRKSLLLLLMSSPSRVTKCSWKLLSQGGKFNPKKPGQWSSHPSHLTAGTDGPPTARCWWGFQEPWPSERGKRHRFSKGRGWLSKAGRVISSARNKTAWREGGPWRPQVTVWKAEISNKHQDEAPKGPKKENSGW